jgi:hypothetical protein
MVPAVEGPLRRTAADAEGPWTIAFGPGSDLEHDRRPSIPSSKERIK